MPLEVWTEYVSYFTYLQITYHYNTKIDLKPVWGFSESDWGVNWIVLSDYFGGPTLITMAITKPDSISKHTGKTSNQSTRAEILEEVFRQVRLSFDNLPRPDEMIISPGIYYQDKKYQTIDQAYVESARSAYLEPQSSMYRNLFAVGTYNGKSKYHFTSCESAVSNALDLVNRIAPEVGAPVLRPLELLDVIKLLLVGICVFLMYKILIR
jgi:hypothetical protein